MKIVKGKAIKLIFVVSMIIAHFKPFVYKFNM